MSIGLAIQNIALYTNGISRLNEKISDLEAKALKATSEKDDGSLKDINRQLATLKAMLGMIKDFLEFWKDVIKTTLSLFKLFGDLARGSQ